MTKNSREKKRARDAKIMNLLSAVVLLAGIVYLLVRRGYRPEEASHPLANAAAARS